MPMIPVQNGQTVNLHDSKTGQYQTTLQGVKAAGQPIVNGDKIIVPVDIGGSVKNQVFNERGNYQTTLY